jgi:putative serine protease PepD
MPLHKMAAFGVAGVLAAFGGAGIAQTLLDGNSTPARPAATTAAPGTTRDVVDDTTARKVYESAHPSVAFISAASQQGEATGSGFVVSSDGLVVTNDHVIDGAQQVTARIGAGTTDYPATVVGVDPSKDLALLRVDTGGAKLQPLPIADSGQVGVGDNVYAIGNPYGLDDTLTTGIVSALDRDIQAPDGSTISGVIQTDAAINPGNSGGPLLDAQGRLIGVNSQIASGGGGGNVGIGFAIPSSTVKQFLDNPPAPQDQAQPESPDQTSPEDLGALLGIS